MYINEQLKLPYLLKKVNLSNQGITLINSHFFVFLSVVWPWIRQWYSLVKDAVYVKVAKFLYGTYNFAFMIASDMLPDYIVA